MSMEAAGNGSAEPGGCSSIYRYIQMYSLHDFGRQRESSPVKPTHKFAHTDMRMCK